MKDIKCKTPHRRNYAALPAECADTSDEHYSRYAAVVHYNANGVLRELSLELT